VLNCFVSSQVGRALVDALKKVQASATRHCAGPVRLLEQWTVNRERQAMNHLNREELSSIQHRQQQLKRKQGARIKFPSCFLPNISVRASPVSLCALPVVGRWGAGIALSDQLETQPVYQLTRCGCSRAEKGWVAEVLAVIHCSFRLTTLQVSNLFGRAR
jgi:hypothetical protein